MNVFFVSLGCDKNLVDSEVMLAILSDNGFTIIDDETKADVIIVNTCAFISDATEEGIQTIIEMGAQKTEGACKALIVTGCMAKRYKENMFEELPEVDAILGPKDYEAIADVLVKVKNGEKSISLISESNVNEDKPQKRILSTAGYYAFLKIAEGCDNHCTYCTIPVIRGKYKSRPIETLVEEAISLEAQGVKELILVAQDTGYYGKDIYGKYRLSDLLRKLSEITGIEWIRILYCYPEHINDVLIEEMKNNKKVCKYIDMPIQHADNHVLKRMGRKCLSDDLRRAVNSLREAMPEIVIRTTVIVGFPGETDQQFRTLAEFMNEIKFDKLGAFEYSPEEGTPAVDFPGHIDDGVKQNRKKTVMEEQRRISYDLNQKRVGERYKVITDGYLPDKNVYVGRGYMDSFEIDGMIFFTSDKELLAGDFIDVVITAASEYDLVGDAV